MLHTLYIRGRHRIISTIAATQTFNAIHEVIRVNATALFVLRIKNMKDLENFIYEVSAIINKLYQTATSEPYSLLYVKLMARDRNEMLLIDTNNLVIQLIKISCLTTSCSS